VQSARRVQGVYRRTAWVRDNLTWRKAANAAVCAAQFALRSEVMRAWPAIVKVDISPICNLHCTICVHARSDQSSNDDLRAQRFGRGDRMTVDHFRALADQVAGKTLAFSMYYLGDPLTHPHLGEMCTIAAQRGINTHVSSNFSFNLSDDDIRKLVSSGLTHLTVCLDGLDQESYSRTRVGGQLDLVLGNLERLLECRRELGATLPKVEVQYVVFRHNVEQRKDAERLCKRLGVDTFTSFWGGLHNYTDRIPPTLADSDARPRRALPLCSWPHLAMVVKFDGSIIPCCVHRIGAQYATGGDSRSIGNCFDDGIWSLWNSAEYRAMRRLVSNPRRSAANGQGAGTFCEGCPKLYRSAKSVGYVSGRSSDWDRLYERDARGRVTRKASNSGPPADGH
jgi:MoaA/NifB/PqqE/SkfB family radical SAM enzyme